MVISKGVKEIAKQMIEYPDDWVQTEYEFVNKTNPDIRIWTSNGWWFLKFRGNEGLSWKERIYLNNAIKKSIANRLNKLK